MTTTPTKVELTTQGKGILPVANGGTGDSTLAAHGVLVGAGASAIAVTSTGTAGQVLTSNGASSDPTFQAGGAVSSLAPFNSMLAPTIVTPVDGNYSWVNQGTATKAVNSGGAIVLTGGGTVASFQMRVKSEPGVPYTLDAGFIAAVGSTFNRTAIGLRESATGKLVLYQFEARGINIESWTNPTTFSAGIQGPSGGSPIAAPIVWYQIVRTSTQATFNYSPDGQNWCSISPTITLTTYFTTAPDQLLFGVCNQSSKTIAQMGLIHWYEH